MMMVMNLIDRDNKKRLCRHSCVDFRFVSFRLILMYLIV